MDSFIRWAGGKKWALPYIKEVICDIDYRHYHEPFLGGGALFFNITSHYRSYLSDANAELINAYICIRDEVDKVIGFLSHYTNTKDEYYRLRSNIPDDKYEKAARFIFLNHTSYNGLYRVNKHGIYNVPYGGRKWACNETHFKSVSEKLKNTNISACDFECNKYKVTRGDLVFLDPPYSVSNNNNGFIKYNQTLFSLTDQYRLSDYIDYIKRKDAYYILTNAAHTTIDDIFDKGDSRIELSRKSLIGGKNAKRESVSELLFTNIPIHI